MAPDQLVRWIRAAFSAFGKHGKSKVGLSREPGTWIALNLTLRFSSQRRKWEVKMIVKVKEGYQVLSERGKHLGGPYKTREEANKRLRQVEFFKHRKLKTMPRQ